VTARVWRGWTRLADAAGYEGHLKPELLPGFEQGSGISGSYLLRHAVGEEVEFMTIILWDSIEAVRAMTGEDYGRAVIPEERKKYLGRFEERAADFKVVAQR
jgi:heme-degrading monooxygenase HmoA